MKLLPLATFTKHYEKLPSQIRKKVDRQLGYLVQDLRHPGIHAKKMSGEADLWEARVDYHYRVVFQIQDDVMILRSVGTHDILKRP